MRCQVKKMRRTIGYFSKCTVRMGLQVMISEKNIDNDNDIDKII